MVNKIKPINLPENIKIYFFIVISMISIFCFSIRNIQQNISIGILPDEYGYWSAGAFFNGLDWSEITSDRAYYSYGYGLILAVCMKIFSDSVLMYQVALVLNAIFLSFCVPIIYICIKDLGVCKDYKILLAISITAICYPANLLYVEMTMSENILLCLQCFLFYLVIKFSKRPTFKYGFFMIIVSMYMFSIHNRAIAAVIAVICVFLLCGMNKKKVKEKIFLVICFLVAFWVLGLIKNSYVSSMYTNASSFSELGVNDFTAQINNLTKLISIDGIKNLLISLMGKIFYVGTATFLIVFMGIIFCVKKVIELYKKKTSRESLPYIYVFITFFLSIGISAVFTVESSFQSTRLDTLIYGRYSEYTIVPILAFGLHYILNLHKREKYIEVMVTISIYLVLLLFLNNYFKSNLEPGIMWTTSSGIADLFYRNIEVKSSFFLVGKRAVMTFFVFFIVAKSKMRCCIKYGNYIVLVGVSFIWICMAMFLSRNCYFSWKKETVATNYKISSSLKENNDRDYIYIYYKGICQKEAQYLQVLMPDCHLVLKYTESQVTDIESGSTILFSKDSINNILLHNKVVIYEDDLYIAVLY